MLWKRYSGKLPFAFRFIAIYPLKDGMNKSHYRDTLATTPASTVLSHCTVSISNEKKNSYCSIGPYAQ